MTSAGSVFTTPADVEGAAQLRQVKALATFVLACCFATFIAARLLEPHHPAFGFLAAFAEAATIGGLADWYAVVALFRHPLGLPIPHTAILKGNQERIADKLGQFIEGHFLEEAPIESKLREVDFASFIADWLSDKKRSGDLARFILRLLPEALAAAETSGLKTFVTTRVMDRLREFDLAPLAAGTIRNFISEGKHQGLLNDLLRALHGTLTQPETIAVIRAKIRDELPSLLKLYRADAFLVKRVMASATSFLDDVQNDPDHAFRGEFNQMLLNFMSKLEHDPDFTKRIDSLKRDLLARPELALFAQGLWDNLAEMLAQGASGEDTMLRDQLARLLREAGATLAADPAIRQEINNGIITVLRRFIAEQKSGVSTFIADQVKAWDMAQLITLIEINIGRDLQYIRFNGSIIGGLAGLTLYTAEYLLRML